MGIVNVTPDSFSDGGHMHAGRAAALRHCEQLLQDGAHILDIGGESTRPGSPAVPLEEELARVLPVVRGRRDAGRAGVGRYLQARGDAAVLDLGADIINDIWALRQPGRPARWCAAPALRRVPDAHAPRPADHAGQPMEGDVCPGALFFGAAGAMAASAGRRKGRIVLDPGIGFGKTVAQNFACWHASSELLAAGFPLLAGWSRKSSLGAVTGLAAVDERMVPSVAAALLAVERGARIVRVHDVRETVQALAVWQQHAQTTLREALPRSLRIVSPGGRKT
jgi:dihydropteroate synthase